MQAEDPSALFQAGKYQEAVAELQTRVSQLKSLTRPSPDDRRELFNSLLALGMSHQALSEEKQAITILTESKNLAFSLDIDPFGKATILDTLARSQQQAGQLAEAEINFRESLVWRKDDQSADAAYWLGVTSDHLGLLLLARGDYQEAGVILTESLASTKSDQMALLAQRNHYVARYFHSIRNYHRAITHAQVSLEIGKTVTGLDLASYLDLLALSRYRSGDQPGAEATLSEALAFLRTQPVTLRRARGEAEILNKVGQFSLNEDASLARISFQEALDGLLAWLPPDHPSLAVYHNNLGLAAMHMGDHQVAEQEFSQALATLNNNVQGLQQGHQRRAEWKQNLAWNALLSGNQEKTRKAVADACIEAEAVLQHLLEKGNERERLNFLARFDLFSLPASANEPELLHGLLTRNKGLLLENLISRKTKAIKTPKSEGLPPGSAFVDFVRYRKPGTNGWVFTYGATLETPDGQVQFVPLADEKVLLRWLKAVSRRLDYRSSIIGGQKVEPPLIRLEPALRQLHEQFLAPILALLPKDTKTLILSPDGSLHFTPFPILLDAKNHFLCHAGPVLYNVSSRRDLKRQAPSYQLKNGSWYLFGISQFEQFTPAESPPWFLENLSPLPHVEEELGNLAKLAPDESQQILNPARPEEKLKKLPAGTTVLHLATHAFFRNSEEDHFLGDLDAQPEILLRSGLALSGPDGSNDGILYPYEIARLPLEQTQLVSLSACHTGLGTPLAGEGVLGLRRAFTLAGAKSLLLTLWQVPDRSTAGFMADFYKQTIQSENPSQALWNLQGQMLANAVGPDPSDAVLEEAVLRYGPFLITHQGPIPKSKHLQTGQKTQHETFRWRYLFWLVAFGSSIGGFIVYSRKK